VKEDLGRETPAKLPNRQSYAATWRIQTRSCVDLWQRFRLLPNNFGLCWLFLCNVSWLRLTDGFEPWLGYGPGPAHYATAYMSQTRDQKRFTISEVAADWHELMIPQHTMRPSIAHVSEQHTGYMICSTMVQPRCSQQTYHHPSATLVAM